MARITPDYDPAHHYAVMWAPETTLITESADGITPPTLPAAPANPVLIGYLSSTPELDRGLNNSRGFSIGSKRANRKKRGARNPKLSFKLQITSLAFLQNGQAETGSELPDFCLTLVIPNKRTIRLRFCKISQRTFTFTETPTGEPGELEVDIQVEAMLVEPVAVPISMTAGALEALVLALGQTFYWHDVRRLDITNAAGATNNYRDAVMSLSITDKTNIERKGERQNWGDNNPMSNTNLALLEHHEEATGELKWHSHLKEDLLTATVDAQNWGDIVVHVSDKPVLGDDDGREFLVTAFDCFPSNVTDSGTESSAQLSSTVPFTASHMLVTDVEEE